MELIRNIFPSFLKSNHMLEEKKSGSRDEKDRILQILRLICYYHLQFEKQS